MNEKIDLRIIKTKKALTEALLTLMKQKNFDKIKISDICEEALINRSTFYAHYEDKYDLLISLIEDIKNNILDELKINTYDYISKEYFMELLKILLEHVDNNYGVYSAIINHNKNGFLIDFLIDVANRDISQRLKDDNNILTANIPISMITRFYLGGVISVLVDWIINNNKYTKEQLLKYINKLIPDEL